MKNFTCHQRLRSDTSLRGYFAFQENSDKGVRTLTPGLLGQSSSTGGGGDITGCMCPKTGEKMLQRLLP